MYKWILSGLIGLACLFGTYLLIYSLPAKQEAAPASTKITVPDRAVNADAAVEIYKQNQCLACHGDQLQGGYGPRLSMVGNQLSKEEIYKKILNGGGGMPKFKEQMTDDELITITNWLASMK